MTGEVATTHKFLYATAGILVVISGITLCSFRDREHIHFEAEGNGLKAQAMDSLQPYKGINSDSFVHSHCQSSSHLT